MIAALVLALLTINPIPVGHRAHHGPNENTIKALHDIAGHARSETDAWNLRGPNGPNTGIPVIIHDQTLRRTVDPASMPAGITPSTLVGNVTLEQWKQLRTYGGKPLPTLHSWLRHAKRWGVKGMVEIKYAPVDIPQVVSWTPKGVSYYHTTHSWRGGCDDSVMTRFKAAGATIGLKADNRNCPETLVEASNKGFSYIITGTGVLTRGYVSSAHALGMRVGNYNSNTPSEWRKLKRHGVDYILASHPIKLERWLDRHAKTPQAQHSVLRLGEP